jgi:MOSC domain-containing protein YiiM
VKVIAIHIAPARRLATRSVESVVAEAGKRLVGDRYHGSRHRHVTIQSQEMLDRAAEELGHGFDCGATRRNLTVDAVRSLPNPVCGCRSVRWNSRWCGW